MGQLIGPPVLLPRILCSLCRFGPSAMRFAVLLKLLINYARKLDNAIIKMAHHKIRLRIRFVIADLKGNFFVYTLSYNLNNIICT